MSMTQNQMHEACVEHVEDYFMDRISQLVDDVQLEYADAIHAEFVIDGCEPQDWLFVNDLTDV